MKMMIASDLHGSAYAAGRVREIFEREKPERLILLGDLLYHGPRNPLPRDYAPMETAEILNGIRSSILAVRGNCDSEVDQMVLQFPIMADCMIWYAGHTLVFATHGHVYNPKTPPQIGPRDILLHGHTHIPVAEDLGDFICLNPGSTSLPKQGYPPSWMLYEDGLFSIRSLEEELLMSYRLPDA